MMEEIRHVIVYYATVSGSRPVQVFLDALPLKARDKCLSYINLLRENGTSLRASHLKKVEGDVWELRPEFGGTEYRLFFGIDREAFVFTHAIAKKRQRIVRSDIEIAQRRFTEWKETRH
jgi:phage-related protein